MDKILAVTNYTYDPAIPIQAMYSNDKFSIF